MDAAKRVLNSERYTIDDRGPVFSRRYVVKDTTSLLGAETAEDMPKKGDILAEKTGLLVDNIRFSCDANGKENVVYADVEWRLPSGSTSFNPSYKQQVRWSTGLMSMHTDSDLDGMLIGENVFHKAKPPNEPPELLARVDDAAVFGADIMIPTLEITVVMEIGAVWNPVTEMELTGCVNDVDFNIQGWTLPASYCLYQGATAEQIPIGQPGSVHHSGRPGYNIERHFTVGSIDPPSRPELNLFWSASGDNYDGPIPIPIRYGIFPVFVPVDEELLYDPEGKQRWIYAIKVFRAYQAKSFNPLGIWR